MKKKLLSLVLAGAMVASTSVSAFAATNPNVTGLDNQAHKTDITVTGDVQNNSGDIKPGNLSVTVPTTANFTVNSEGKFVGTEINIENSGTQKIDVLAYEFIDRNKDGGINVVKEEAVATENKRTTVSLKLEGNEGTAYFLSAGTGKNVFSNLQCTTEGGEDGVRVASIRNGESYKLQLKGTSNSSAAQIDNPESDTFTLRLKIKKSTTN